MPWSADMVMERTCLSVLVLIRTHGDGIKRVYIDLTNIQMLLHAYCRLSYFFYNFSIVHAPLVFIYYMCNSVKVQQSCMYRRGKET
jgi:hypothetical protein